MSTRQAEQAAQEQQRAATANLAGSWKLKLTRDGRSTYLPCYSEREAHYRSESLRTQGYEVKTLRIGAR